SVGTADSVADTAVPSDSGAGPRLRPRLFYRNEPRWATSATGARRGGRVNGRGRSRAGLLRGRPLTPSTTAHPPMKVVLFCGGEGMRIREHAGPVPKPMVRIGYRPILWHVMKYYAHYGHRDFILCLGHGA